MVVFRNKQRKPRRSDFKFYISFETVCNILEWTNENREKRICDKRPISEAEAREIKRIRFGSSDYQALQTEMMNKHF
jgi:hypothetical protein